MKKVVIFSILTAAVISLNLALDVKNNKKESNPAPTFGLIEEECSLNKNVMYNIIYDKTKDSEEANEKADEVYRKCIEKYFGNLN